ncbi:NAD(P)/FAD-dependent oxidoreductase [Streptomyces xiaopingdaonensis]|uniref:NAD(P)/FAD-dependent oxidoreductase n=1 Tax=Streptomyces xiaopingdaonensis TaxID=1565415 RepID=UPI00031FBEE7|nr:FAD-dependent oxidoreductase [Streptomyces xiaopingdaonensis]
MSDPAPPRHAQENGNVSFWFAQTGFPPRRPPLQGPTSADVCVVGAGYTGLWTAYHLKKARPDWDVVVLEREFAGFGASGRNGGWLSGKIPGSPARFAKERGRSAVLRFQALMNAEVDEVLAAMEHEGIEADAVRSGYLRVAHAPAQLERLRASVEHDRHWGHEDEVLLTADELAERINVAGGLAAAFNPHCARVHPAKLVTGLAAAVTRLGVRLHESTPVTRIAPRTASTPFGDVHARYVLRCTEGYTAGLPGERRTWLAMNSSMIVTEPLPHAVWENLGWAGHELFSDQTHAYLYGQRTADGRIALGGRGVPYRFGSRVETRGATSPATVASLGATLARLFPSAAGSALAHAWSGVLAVPRDWCPSVHLERSDGLGWAGGYTGQGVTASHLAARTLTDLVLGEETERTRLPWTEHTSRRWEPEPARWLGVRGMYAAYRAADRQESAGRSSTSPLAHVADAISGT